MIDAEVMRLRRLRGAALRARALADALDSSASRRGSVFSRNGLACWRIARMITGRLRAHPDLRYQQGPGEWRVLADRINAGVRSAAVRSRTRALEVMAGEMQSLARELDDARALTWSPDLSDELGRSQIQIRRLIAELGGASRQGAGLLATRSTPQDSIPEGASDVERNWPYLAF
jgi:hypothetical protein